MWPSDHQHVLSMAFLCCSVAVELLCSRADVSLSSTAAACVPSPRLIWLHPLAVGLITYTSQTSEFSSTSAEAEAEA
eukprot:m.150976 g.150976  ORF g.150976 m.150976 type:complete len:77 (+) comp16189_c0_seq1:46-276(+)